MCAKANSYSLTEALIELRASLRQYEERLDRSKRKQLGQFFTGSSASSLLAALAVRGNERIVLDPMVGHGDLLDAVGSREAKLGNRVHLVGIEIDAEVKGLAEKRLSLCSELWGHTFDISQGNSFDSSIVNNIAEHELCDLVIANPPYVRYQVSSRSGVIVREGNGSEEIRSQLRQIVARFAHEEERELWTTLVDAYSGLADMTIPSWILCSLLVKPGGVIALVVPRTWMNRDYARIVRYINVRFFKPLAVVEEDGVGWFEDALVPTTLVLSERLTPLQASVPLSKREQVLDAGVILASISTQARREGSLVGEAFPGGDPEGQFAAWLSNWTPAQIVTGVEVKRTSLDEEIEHTIAACSRESWLARTGEVSCSSHRYRKAALPSVLREIVGRESVVRLVTLEHFDLHVGQGLRTGCNEFFYVEFMELDEEAEWSCVRVGSLLGSELLRVPSEILKPVIRKQSDLRESAVNLSGLIGRVLDLRGWALPEDLRGNVTGLRTIPEPLASFIRRASQTSLEAGDETRLIPNLSAVRTNVRAAQPSEALFDGIGLPRFWYTLPDFAPRHLPVLFVPRVNHETPLFFLNRDSACLVDANFSTVYGTSPTIRTAAAFALLNSTWCRTFMESIGTPMGGGALKLEATHLRELAFPLVAERDLDKLTTLGERLSRTARSECSTVVADVDQIILGYLINGTGAQSDIVKLSGHLKELLAKLVQRRSRSVREVNP